MFKYLLTNSHTATARRFFTFCLGGGVVLLGFWSFRQPAPPNALLSDRSQASPVGSQRVQGKTKLDRASEPMLQGAAARKYLQQPGEGQSLMRAITIARFGLKSQEHGPFGEAGAGYLGMSHEQNLNAWFASDGVTVRPTVPESERVSAWHLELRLKAYGYGNDLIPAPPIVSHDVKDNRIEYRRAEDFKSQPSNLRFQISNSKFQSDWPFRSPIDNQQSTVTEWYENRAEGIEQGFTIGARLPSRSITTNEPLRLVVSIEGDLRAQISDAGRTIEMSDSQGKRALRYSKLTAVDAVGKQLATRMETGADGSEISLVVDDRYATYPIVIDPIVASREQILDAQVFGSDSTQTGAQFGDAVAISGDRAVVGEWLFDSSPFGLTNNGGIYVFTRSGTTWSYFSTLAGQQTGAECGYSVAIFSDRVVYGCPGTNGNAGKAFVYNLSAAVNPVKELLPGSGSGSFFGASVAISDSFIAVGAPLAASNSGQIVLFDAQAPFALHLTLLGSTNWQHGTGVALEGTTLIVGNPGDGPGSAVVYTLLSGGASVASDLRANDGQTGDLFGQSVAVSGNVAVLSAPGDDDKGIDAGAAYVFVRDASGRWSQQQKLTASDGKANDAFSYFSVAVEGNTIVIGARRQDGTSANVNDNRGAAYVFTRTGTVWSQQTRLEPAAFFGAPGDEFGAAVGISGNSVVVGVVHAASLDGKANAGTAYVYRLDCTPPSGYTIIIDDGVQDEAPMLSECPGGSVTFVSQGSFARVRGTDPLTYQWRKNGVNIPGANSSLYKLTNVNSGDAGTYELVVSNSCGGGDVTGAAVLSIHSFNINPTNQNFAASGSNSIVNIAATGTCPWTAVSNASFINITSGASGLGNGTVGFTVAANSTPNQRTGTITIAGKTFTVTQDGATQNVVQFNASNYNVVEDCTTVTITVNRVGDTSGAASVDYNTSDVTATERKDYIKALGSLRFAAGETSKSFAVLINEDSFVEGNETFNINLSNPLGVNLGGPAITAVTIVDDASETTANPIDDPQNYVCQHYHDFLNRQPDPSGLQFWTNQITSCGSDQACIEGRRINVSASFFLSIEFQDTGYLVERIYKAAYGDATGNSTFPSTHQLAVPVVRLNEFLADTQEIGLGVIVGPGNWQQQIENNKQAFTAAFVQRTRFTTAFPSSMTSAQFVDTLNTNAGNPLSSAKRNQLVNELSSNVKTRAQVLRAVAEDSDLNTAESNRAFVLMQYFGYLRRNPNDPQDSDHTGYDFWLTKLNQFGGNYINAEMVKAFITSFEYRQRFGTN